jgi:hypothetical protein
MKKDYRELYEKITKSDWFKKAYQDKSLGECPIVVEELEESEDEKIRKELVEQVGYIIPNNEEYDDEGLVLPTYHKRIERYRTYLEKQKEQKPDIEICPHSIKSKSYSMQKEQKPAWSEEDERRIDAICELLENTSAIHPNYSHRKLIIWLKSLRPQPKKGLHPGSIRKVDNPMKWMEEDEKEREQKPVTWSEEENK